MVYMETGKKLRYNFEDGNVRQIVMERKKKMNEIHRIKCGKCCSNIGSIGIDVDHTHLIVGDALMNMFYPTVSMLYHHQDFMLESAGKISHIPLCRGDSQITRNYCAFIVTPLVFYNGNIPRYCIFFVIGIYCFKQDIIFCCPPGLL